MSAWQYNLAGDFGRTVSQRWADAAGREPDLLCDLLRSAGAVAVRAMLSTYFRFRVEGRERLPADGSSFVMVANHASHLDALCLLAALPMGDLGRAHPAAAADYFFASPVAGALSGVFLNAMPFARKGAAVRRSLTACREMLAAPGGNILIVFPEGTRSTDGAIGRFKGGVGELVAGTRVPVVPCHLSGTGRAWPKGAWWPRPRRVTLTVGEAMTFEHLARGREASGIVAGRLESAVRTLGRIEMAAGRRPAIDREERFGRERTCYYECHI
jgi:1-acyl-sn-glycerol-3-phosphate acyltransferase